MVFDKPITIDVIDQEKETWSHYLNLHACVNKTKNNEYFNSGAVRSSQTLTFEVRYCPPLKVIALNTQLYRIKYDGAYYNVVDYDDYMMKHLTVKLVGSSYE